MMIILDIFSTLFPNLLPPPPPLVISIDLIERFSPETGHHVVESINVLGLGSMCCVVAVVAVLVTSRA